MLWFWLGFIAGVVVSAAAIIIFSYCITGEYNPEIEKLNNRD